MAGHQSSSAVDSIQERLTQYACRLNYEDVSPEAVHAIKVRIIDTLGVVIAGFSGEACHVARKLAARMPDANGATIFGTPVKTTVEMAAFVNGTTARFAELNDFYHWPGSSVGHPSDVVMPVLAVAEHAQLNGRELVAGMTLAYEVYLRLADAVLIPGFDAANFCCIATAVAAGKMLGLSREQLAHCISLAVVPNNALNQSRRDNLTMWKAAAAGHAGRAGVLAALLAREGMEGPHLPFEGKAGWCAHVSQKRFSLPAMGGENTYFKVLDTSIKRRASSATAISAILAAEKVAPVIKGIDDVQRVVIEVDKRAKENCAGSHMRHPDTKETADHSIPYVVAAALKDGTVTPRQYTAAYMSDPNLRALMQKIEVVVNPDFTKAFNEHVHHCTRITVRMRGGEQHVGESGGDKGDSSDPMSVAQIEEKFRVLVANSLGAERVRSILKRLWALESMTDVSALAPYFVMA